MRVSLYAGETQVIAILLMRLQRTDRLLQALDLLSQGLDSISRLDTGDRLVVLRILLSLAFLLWATSCWVPLLTTCVTFFISKVLLVVVALGAGSQCSSSFLLLDKCCALGCHRSRSFNDQWLKIIHER